jgi:hypothetical protein
MRKYQLRGLKFSLMAVSFVAGLFLFLASGFALTAKFLLMDTSLLKGVDTLLVRSGDAPGYQFLNFDKSFPTDAILCDAAKKAFSSVEGVSIRCVGEVTDSDVLKPNVLVLWFKVSARQDLLGGDKVTVGAISMGLYRVLNDDETQRIFTNSEAFPFIIPYSRDAYNTYLADGVRALTAELPDAFALANGKPLPPANEAASAPWISPNKIPDNKMEPKSGETGPSPKPDK